MKTAEHVMQVDLDIWEWACERSDQKRPTAWIRARLRDLMIRDLMERGSRERAVTAAEGTAQVHQAASHQAKPVYAPPQIRQPIPIRRPRGNVRVITVSRSTNCNDCRGALKLGDQAVIDWRVEGHSKMFHLDCWGPQLEGLDDAEGSANHESS